MMPNLCWVLACLILSITTCHGLHFSGIDSRKNTYSASEEIYATVNALTSSNAQLPFVYYTLPYCEPPQGLRKSAMNLGQMLMGDRMENSPYRFRMNVNETVFLCAKGPLSVDEVELLEQKIGDQYKINMDVDDLPVTWSTNGLRLIGVPVGYNDYSGIRIPIRHIGHFFYAYIFNHLKFRILIHEHEGSGLALSEFEIVGFEVVPCSVKHNLTEMSKLHMHDNIFQSIDCSMERDKAQIIYENQTIVFSYEVVFVKTDITWPSRWDAYMEPTDAKVRQQAILYTVIIVLILQVGMFFHFRAMIRDLKKGLKNELSGWRILAGDVFREPWCVELLCVMVGDGVQIAATILATVVLTVIGFASPFSRGMLLTTMIILHISFSPVAGYTSVRLRRTIKATSEEWKSVSMSVAFFFPGSVFIFLLFSNILLLGTGSTKTISFSLFSTLVSLWLFVSVPLTLIGGFIGTKATAISYHVPKNEAPSHISINYPQWVLILIVGFIPYSIFSNELLLLFRSIWLGKLYPAYGFLLFVFAMLILVCSQVSVLIAYKALRREDWHWWWKAFFASGSAGIYVFYTSIKYLVKMRVFNGPVLAMLYGGYSLIVAIAVMLATGSIGFLVSFYFVHRLHSLHVKTSR